MTDPNEREAAPPPRDVFRHPGFLRFWTAETVSGFGDYVTVLALQVLVVTTLGGTAVDVGLLGASRWLPYLLFGLVLGVLIDRRRRRPVLIATDLGCAVLLALIPVLWWLGWLSLLAVLAIAFAYGTLTLMNDSASQSYLPRLVPRSALLAANARIDQSGAVAQTTGPIVGGALISALTAPIAILVDVASYLVSALTLSRIRVGEPAANPPDGRRSLFAELAEGLRWVYRHRMLAPLAIATHVWFLFNSILGTAFVAFVLLGLHLDALHLGITLATAGLGSLVGALYSTRLGIRWGAGRTAIVANLLMPLGWVVVALAPGVGVAAGGVGAGAGIDPGAVVMVVGILCLGQFIFGAGMGLENANTLGYRQSVTPDALQGRMNTSIRSINRAMIVVGAPIGGILAETIGYREAMWIGIAGLIVVAIILAVSPFRRARHGDI
ncbi:MFS family permease [Cryobacterium mesophilum]|uniref:MFS transporter n=1 Tax=Terrimesophilobacter mesophilus TaxID=433647 RepID=A0A4R8VA10_9MICO|nr:MFS transporter [Terrimesophilobacter mesophilus]MBB5633283.1 MFS family permease [Terrimesophilobacter mesophilus]TFB80024.1 MFS transporter [Terrimesophilobacter mesophilus]